MAENENKVTNPEGERKTGRSRKNGNRVVGPSVLAFGQIVKKGRIAKNLNHYGLLALMGADSTLSANVLKRLEEGKPCGLTLEESFRIKEILGL